MFNNSKKQLDPVEVLARAKAARNELDKLIETIQSSMDSDQPKVTQVVLVKTVDGKLTPAQARLIRSQQVKEERKQLDAHYRTAALKAVREYEKRTGRKSQLTDIIVKVLGEEETADEVVQKVVDGVAQATEAKTE